jgi:hypothetical protein
MWEDMLYEKEEEMRQKTIDENAEMLSYMRMMRQITEKMSTISIKGKGKVIQFFNSQIDELEWSAGIAPRYTYVLNYPTDFGSIVKPSFVDKEFNTIQEVVDFITEFIKSDAVLFDKEEYKYPTTSFIESEFEWYGRVVIDVSEGEVPSFRLTRKRIY